MPDPDGLGHCTVARGARGFEQVEMQWLCWEVFVFLDPSIELNVVNIQAFYWQRFANTSTTNSKRDAVTKPYPDTTCLGLPYLHTWGFRGQ